jgi:hypothetical protein
VSGPWVDEGVSVLIKHPAPKARKSTQIDRTTIRTIVELFGIGAPPRNILSKNKAKSDYASHFPISTSDGSITGLHQPEALQALLGYLGL